MIESISKGKTHVTSLYPILKFFQTNLKQIKTKGDSNRETETPTDLSLDGNRSFKKYKATHWESKVSFSCMG